MEQFDNLDGYDCHYYPKAGDHKVVQATWQIIRAIFGNTTQVVIVKILQVQDGTESNKLAAQEAHHDNYHCNLVAMVVS